MMQEAMERTQTNEAAFTPKEASRLPRFRSVLAVQNYGTSGTLFLQSLLDGHPGIISLPALYTQQLYPFYDRCGEMELDALLDEFYRANDFWFDEHLARTHAAPVSLGVHQMGEKQDQALVIDRAVFDAQFRKLMQPYASIKGVERRPHFIKSVYLAYDVARGSSDARGAEAVLLYPIHSLPIKYADWMRQDFPECRILHCVREPLQNMGSAMKHIIRYPEWERFDPLECMLGQMLNDWQLHGGTSRVWGYRPFFPEGIAYSAAVKLEDLHKQPREALGAILGWLGLPWDDCVMKSTYNGLAWWNRPESKRVSGFSDQIIGQKHEGLLTEEDRAYLTPLLSRQNGAWGYAPAASKLQLLMLLPKLFTRMSLEKYSERKATQVKAYFKAAKMTPPKEGTLTFKFFALGYQIMEYLRCRRWLLAAWWKTFTDSEAVVKLLPLEKTA